MPGERHRILELALESLELQKRRLDEEIATLTRELRRGAGARGLPAAGAPARAKTAVRRKGPRFSPEERARRAARMKAYWAKWRKDKASAK